MAVTEEMEILVRRLRNFGQIFEIQRSNEVLNFTVREGNENPWFTLQNIVFDRNEEIATITYTLNDVNYICSANISDPTPFNFEFGALIVNNINAPEDVLKTLVLILGFLSEYSMGRGLDLVSKRERSIEFSGLQISFRRNPNLQ